MRAQPRPAGIRGRRVALLALDLDGTVRHGFDELGRFVNRPEDVVVFPEAVERMREWKAAGGRIVGVTNQGGVALGHVSEADVVAALLETHRQAEGLFDAIEYCVHHPSAKDPEMARCWCRKPSPGMLVVASMALAQATGEVYPPHLGLMVGDRPEDREFARLAALDFLDARAWRAGWPEGFAPGLGRPQAVGPEAVLPGEDQP
jgi:D-glycero-D-manno-heptose 1,7-bisphosphate phosphatase